MGHGRYIGTEFSATLWAQQLSRSGSFGRANAERTRICVVSISELLDEAQRSKRSCEQGAELLLSSGTRR